MKINHRVVKFLELSDWKTCVWLIWQGLTWNLPSLVFVENGLKTKISWHLVLYKASSFSPKVDWCYSTADLNRRWLSILNGLIKSSSTRFVDRKRHPVQDLHPRLRWIIWTPKIHWKNRSISSGSKCNHQVRIQMVLEDGAEFHLCIFHLHLQQKCPAI